MWKDLKKGDKAKCNDWYCCNLNEIATYKVLSNKQNDFISIENINNPIRKGGLKLIGCEKCLVKIK